ncbi:MAG: phenylalanine--tRNA ligase subunit beta [Rhodocyclaceae bacterium]|jgi:phenylalanyl-tRNA synthetase beta chain|nr:phenylalanine--tRNA ligase subunit beta [Rhodocyclaceae bacterium]
MQFSEYWLRELVNPSLSADQLGHLLTMAGLEVEEQNPVAPPFEKVVVGHILTAEKHSDADKLKVCSVDVGAGAPLQIVCGAPNAEAGMKVPCALVGARLPGFEIKPAKLRGVESFGMLCSGRELGLSDDQGGLLRLAVDAPVGLDVRALLGLDDTLFTIKLTPNRADCLSLVGVAREVAAITGAPLTLPECIPVEPTIDATRAIVLDAPQACPRYCGRILRGVDAKAPTPGWMADRLSRCGLRPISALVDVTNYVMLELGQPLHAFDNAKLEGAIHVRLPAEGEQFVLLNGQTVAPDPSTLLIADERGVLAMAGVMGGEYSGISLETRDVFLESAFFTPSAIAGRARRYGFSSDASHRFERGVDPELAPCALERATTLILQICGGAAGPVVRAESTSHLPVMHPVRLRPERVRKLLGLDLNDQEIIALLERVHLRVEEQGDVCQVIAPSYRFDIEIEEDLVEEVARLHGYDNMPAPEPRGVLAMLPQTEESRSRWTVRHLMAGRDFQEVVNFAFVDDAWEADFCGNAKPVRLANPIASQMSVMRSSLVGGLIANLATNRKRQVGRVRVFEVGRCFAHDPAGTPVAGYYQPVRLAALAAGPVMAEQWGSATRNADFFDLKGDLESIFAPRLLEFRRLTHPALHPGRSAEVLLSGESIGILGELHPQWVQKYDLGVTPVVFEVDMAAAELAGLPTYAGVSRMPAVSRDLAFVLDGSVAAADLLKALQGVAAPIVTSIELFDMYDGKGIGEGKKSLAFRVLMQDTQRTLEESEVEAAITALVRHGMESFAAQLRG